MEASYLGRYEFFLYSNGVGAVVAVTGLMVLCCAKRGSLSVSMHGIITLFTLIDHLQSTPSWLTFQRHGDHKASILYS